MGELQAFLDSEAGLALKGAVIAMFADWVTGSIRAISDGTFTMDAVAAFLRKHGMRVTTLGTLLLLGYYGGASGVVFLPAAIAGLVAYAAETAASILGNLAPSRGADVAAKEDKAEALGNPIPQD